MSTPTVFMFSGQGSQHFGMGETLYHQEPVFRTELDRLDTMVAELLGRSVVAQLYHGGRVGEPFTDTLVTHPAIVMIELAAVELLRADGIVPDLLLGASLGEFTSAAVSGVLTVPECLRLVVEQARTLQGLPSGGMLAVLADPGLHARMPELRDHTDLAARNGPEHFVVSGAEDGLAAAEAALRAAEVPCQRVPVEYAFHSRLLDVRRAACQELLGGLELREPRVPLVSCATGEQVARPTAEHYWQVVSGPIEFERAVRGLERTGPHRYLDLGPSSTLHNLTTALLGPARGRSYPLLSIFGHDSRQLAKVRDTFRPAPGAAPRTVRPAPSVRPAPPPAEGASMQVAKVYGFPGQGSQSQGMGAELFDRFPAETAAADAVLGYSVRELCEHNPQGRLRQTEYTQPALYTVSALAYLARQEEDPVPPDYLVGHSLGEYAALFAAGVFDFETGLRMVARRGELMGQVATGSMAAVVGCDLPTVESLIAGIDDVHIANINAADQIVLAGSDSGLDAVKPPAEAAGARYGRLRVGGALHSPFVSGAAEEFGRFLAGLPLEEPRIPVIANVDARPHDAAGLVHRLTRQMDHPVRWLDSVRYLRQRGPFEFVELGPGRVLRNLVARIEKQASAETPAAAPPVAAPAGTGPSGTGPSAAAEPAGPAHAAGPAAGPGASRAETGPASGPAPEPAPVPPADGARSAPVATGQPGAAPAAEAGPAPGPDARTAEPTGAASGPTVPAGEPAAPVPEPSTATPGPTPAPTPAPGPIARAPEPVGPTAGSSAAGPVAAAPAVAGPGSAAGWPDADGAAEFTGLGAASFRARYGLRHACVAGSMYGGVSGPDLLSRLAKSGGMGFYGAGGLTPAEVESGLGTVVAGLGRDNPYGAALPYQQADPEGELALAELYLRLGVRVVEASGHLEITPALVKFRLKGGAVLAKVNRTDLAEQLLSPAPADVVRHLREHGHLTAEEAADAGSVPVATDLVVEAGAGWLSSPASVATVLPSVLRLRDRLAAGARQRVHVGAAGGIGTPEAAAAALFMGAEFLLTGSINQCTVEAATSPHTKDILQSLSVHDVDDAPWPEMFELGVRNTVVRKGVFYPAKAAKLHQLWRAHDRWQDIDPGTRDEIERRYLRRPFAEALAAAGPGGSPKQDMAAVFRSYLVQGLALARQGDTTRKVDYHIPCGPAMGAFNDWVRGTELEPWQRRNIDTITEHLLGGTAKLLDARRCDPVR
ncbi:trans-AT polyketide synthase, acyltransferase and oxidoreductase domain-containing protein [Streptomyces qinglanensis]|uniref:[acyl-carrier-protein] S-malonyltransferase n=2 Tax=Streptomyces qinglanensis TaxID=943816 RepID=A0A1H9V1E9_9ACTN|nr:ACP S-malonyltransferase [Streptomyces qinglanensis]SES15600.1 trans-AT polyketide synthase, acyltransferase and oxidoreductase domain-containing protein [Streptomyces qinglanensis]